MMYYIESADTDPYHNLALEQIAFDRLDRRHSYCMLWQNKNAIIIGRHQNTAAEINASFVRERGITVARRLSGGGAVYHDLGNLNFTFITSAGAQKGIDFAHFCKPIGQALGDLGVPAVLSGRNDMTVEGKKFSGNAQYIKEGRIMHHGTILYDSDLSILSQALSVSLDKVQSKGIRSVQSRVANIRPYMRIDMPMADFWAALKAAMLHAFDMEELALSAEDRAAAEALRDRRYAQWSWNYGASPAYTLRKLRRIEGCGTIEALLDLDQGGIIKNLLFYGDFFGTGDPQDLAGILAGHPLEYRALSEALKAIDVSSYFHAMTRDDFLLLLLE